MNSNQLFSIIAYARSGALDLAWRLFREAGFDAVRDDAAVLSVRGRLLKDQALARSGAGRTRLFYEASEAYALASQLNGATYPLINAATLSLLAGSREKARDLAQQVLAQTVLQDEAETPYYRLATRAEALLLLGDVAQANAVLDEAIGLAPRAYEDHASTLRQFGLILEAEGEDKAWLDAFRPPRCLHYAGHMALASKGEPLALQVENAIAAERIGFAYGALAAGADILIAEVLLQENVELNLILPAPPNRFRDASVAPFGPSWAARFDDILSAAQSVRSLGHSSEIPSILSLELAAEVAMGRAVMQAGMLMTEAVQLLILDPGEAMAGASGSSGWIGSLWKSSGRRQRVLLAERVQSKAAGRGIGTEAADECLTTMLRIEFSSAQDVSSAALERLAQALGAGPKPSIAPRWTGEAVVLAFDNTADAAIAALAAVAALEDATALRVAGHRGIATRCGDPFGDGQFLIGPALSVLAHMAASVPRGAVHVTEDFAAALCVGAAQARPRVEHVGELPAEGGEEATRLYSLTR